MSDPERLSRRATGLAAELLRAGSDEQPDARGVQQTLLALGVSGVVMSAGSAAGATTLAKAQLTSMVSASTAATGVGLSGAGSINTVSATLIVKWLGIGAVGGFGLAGMASVATQPTRVSVSQAPTSAARVEPARPRPATRHLPPPAVVSSATAEVAASAAPLPRASTAEVQLPEPPTDVAAPLAAEVAYVDRARALLAAGHRSQGLLLLEQYEQKFSEARFLPEVLFLRLEAYQRADRGSEARSMARRLVAAFPNSPNVGRARTLLAE
jgi:hypothetical protein